MTTRRAELEPPAIAARAQTGRRALLLLLLASPLAACGRRGRLELPPGEQQRYIPPPIEDEEDELG